MPQKEEQQIFENTFDGPIEHFRPREVVKYRQSPRSTPISATVRCVHIYGADDVRYDVELWDTEEVIQNIKSARLALK